MAMARAHTQVCCCQHRPRLVDDGHQVGGVLQRGHQAISHARLAPALERKWARDCDRGEVAARAQLPHQVQQLRGPRLNLDLQMDAKHALE